MIIIKISGPYKYRKTLKQNFQNNSKIKFNRLANRAKLQDKGAKESTLMMNQTASRISQSLRISEYVRPIWSRADKIQLLMIGIAILSLIIYFPLDKYSHIFAVFCITIGFIAVAYNVFIGAVKGLIKGHVLGEKFLMMIATIGAYALGDFPEALSVMLLYQIGELLQDRAEGKSKNTIASLIQAAPETAKLQTDEGFKTVPSKSVLIGSIIKINSGQEIPIDGIITEGSGYIDASAITGESVPVYIEPNDVVLSGSILSSGSILIKTTKLYINSTMSKILDLVANAAESKSQTENIIERFTKVYTPVIVLAALLVAVVGSTTTGDFRTWIYRSLVLLVISCPCALVISVPLGYLSGLGAASRNNILIKGSKYLDKLNNLRVLAFDKTGTLTQGKFTVNKISSIDKMSSTAIIQLVASLEQNSNHPLAAAIHEKSANMPLKTVTHFKEYPGLGIAGTIDGTVYLAGNAKLMQQSNIKLPDNIQEFGTIIFLANSTEYLGNIIIGDKLKASSSSVINQLHKLNIRPLIMLTGDNTVAARSVQNELKIDKVYANLLPEDKLSIVSDYQIEYPGKVGFVGDGINDTPVLAKSDVGFSMGALGSDAAISASDVVLVNDDPEGVVTAIKIARTTTKTIWSNIIFALLIKSIFILLGILGYATMWSAIFADTGVTILAILNSFTIYLKKYKG